MSGRDPDAILDELGSALQGAWERDGARRRPRPVRIPLPRPAPAAAG